MSKTAHILALSIGSALEGVKGYHKCDSLALLKGCQVWVGPRPVLEEATGPYIGNRPVRQVIPYVVVVDEQGRKLVYKRETSGNEERLHGLLSIGLGGHVDLADCVIAEDGSIDLAKTIEMSAARELEEEASYSLAQGQITWSGIIKLENTRVDEVHIGIVGWLTVKESDANFSEEIGNASFMTDDEINAAVNEGAKLESWTAAILENKEQN